MNYELNRTMNNKQKPTDSELEVLQLLWELGPSSVRDINEKLNLKREVGYTTTLKIMQIMNEKGLVIRDTKSRSHIYKSAIKETSTKQNLLKEFISTTFNGSAKNLVLQALGGSKTSKKELEEIKELIKRIEKENRK